MQIKQKFNSAKETVVAHKTHILAGALVVMTAGAMLQKSGLKDHDKFLKEEGLYDKYYELNEYDVPTN